MRTWNQISWVVAIALALAASWTIWRYVPVAVAELHFAAALTPLIVLALLPMMFWGGGTTPRSRMYDFGEQRKAVVAVLMKHGLAGRRARQSLPLYLVIGAEGSGKSSLLDRSGLKLGMPTTIAGATWWVGENAIFVETAVGTSVQTLRGVCEIVSSLRPALPINGMMFVLSPSDLTLADQAETQVFAECVSQALHEVKTITAQTTAVYVLLSKIDLLPGFREFFDRQELQERMQPWGFTLPFVSQLEPGAPEFQREAVADGFRLLLAAMSSRLIEFLSREADPVRNARIHGFGAQVAAVQTTVQPVLDALFGTDERAGSNAVVRGIFLTSARQERLSIDGLLPDLSRRFAMPRVGMLPPDLGLEDEECGRFIGDVFKYATFKEAGLAKTAHRGRFSVAHKWAGVGILAITCAAVGYLVLQTFGREIHHATHVSNVATSLPIVATSSDTIKLSSIVTVMRRLEELASSLDNGNRPSPYAVGFGAGSHLKSAVVEVRDRYRKNALLPSLIALLENRLVNVDAELETLKANMSLADGSVNSTESDALTDWLESEADALPEVDRTFFVRESKIVLQANGGVTVDPIYLATARRIVAYKESSL